MDLFDSNQADVSTGNPLPLAEAMRPTSLDEFVGQSHLLAPGKVLHALLQQQQLPSMILWGPPGTGKTTLARIIASQTNRIFREFSAVNSSLSDIKQVVEEARTRQRLYRQQLLVFIDEIHRFNKTQQDAFLPHIESGLFVLIGATTENPSFSVNGALLSRCRVFVLEPLTTDELKRILERTMSIQQTDQEVEPAAVDALLHYADGDARKLLTVWQTVNQLLPPSASAKVDIDIVKEAIQQKHVLYDRAGEEHFNLISALHKSIRDSDPQATVYWLARMLEAGEDPLFIARRITRAAAEDIGLADPQALTVAAAAFTAVERIGLPESNVILTEAAVYLALAPKSNALYQAYDAAKQDVAETANQPVPLHLRNAPTQLMKQLGYGQGYQYAHDHPDARVDQQHLPDAVKSHVYYQPQRGWELDQSSRPTRPSASRQRQDSGVMNKKV